MGRQRPRRVPDAQGVLHDYAELIGLLQRQLHYDGADLSRVVVEGRAEAALNWRQARIDDVTNIVHALGQVSVPFDSRSSAIIQLTVIRRQLGILGWPEREDELRSVIDRLIRRLQHTTRRPGLPAQLARQLKPAASLPALTATRRSRRSS